MKKIFTGTIIMLFMLSINISASGSPEFVRVGLKYGSTAQSSVNISSGGFVAGYYDGVHFRGLLEINADEITAEAINGEVYISEHSGGGAKIEIDGNVYALSLDYADGYGGYSLPETAVLIKEGGRPLFVSTRDNAGVIGRGGGTTVRLFGNEYRGGVSLRRAGGKGITVINIVGIEDYLYGVVPCEMPYSFHIEALKAQAVCARNYCITQMGKYESHGFDVTDDQYSQVYKGVSVENEITNRACDETAGRILKYDGGIVQTFFFSMDGGSTEDVKNVWGSNIPYLTAVDDPYEETETIKGGLWSVEMTPEEIRRGLVNWGVDIGDILNVRVDEYTPGGSVLRLVVTGTYGDYEFLRESARNSFGFRSQKFTVKQNGGSRQNGNLPVDQRYPKAAVAVNAARFLTISDIISDNVSAKLLTAGEPLSFTFEGRGYGHGIGMSQWGAQGMAQAGFNYEQILKHFYTGSYFE